MANAFTPRLYQAGEITEELGIGWMAKQKVNAKAAPKTGAYWLRLGPRRYGVIPLDKLLCWVDAAGDPTKVFNFAKLSDGDLVSRPLDDSTDQLFDSWAATFKFPRAMDVVVERLRLYDNAGSAAGSGQPPFRIGYKRTPTSSFEQVGIFDGGKYQQWNDEGSETYRLVFPKDVHADQMQWLFDFRRVTLPTQAELIGWWYDYEQPEVSTLGTDAANVGVNTYGYELNTPAKAERYRGFKRVRAYMERATMRSDANDPDKSAWGFTTKYPDEKPDTWRIGFAYGGTNHDAVTATMQGMGVQVLACVMGADPEQARSWPGNNGDPDTLPCFYGQDQHDPATWLQAADGPEQVVIRLGHNKNVPVALNKHADTPIFWWDPAQEKVCGLGGVDAVGGVQEFQKPWKGVQAYFRPRAFMFYKSVCHDGHQGKFPGRGVKVIDPKIVHMMGGYYFADWGHYLATVEEAEIERGLLPNGLVDVPWDVVDFHGYPNDEAGTRGMPLELSPSRHGYRQFVQVVKSRTPQVKVHLNEIGYSLGPHSVQYVGATKKFTALQRQAHLLVRAVEICVGYGIDGIDVYQGPDDWKGVAFPDNEASDQRCGIMEPDGVTLRPAACWLVQRNLELDGFSLAEIGNPQEDPNVPYWRRYTKPGVPDKVTVWVGQECDAELPFTFKFPGKKLLTKTEFQDSGTETKKTKMAIKDKFSGMATEQLTIYSAI